MLLSAEDGLTTTILPRLSVAGAEMDRMESISGVPAYTLATGRALARSCRVPLDIRRLEHVI